MSVDASNEYFQRVIGLEQRQERILSELAEIKGGVDKIDDIVREISKAQSAMNEQIISLRRDVDQNRDDIQSVRAENRLLSAIAGLMGTLFGNIGAMFK